MTRLTPYLLLLTALSLAGCDDTEPATTTPDATVSMDALVDEPIADAAPDATAQDAEIDLGYGAPVRWATPIDDYIEAGEIGLEGADFLHGIHDLEVFDGRLYLGYGDATTNMGRITPIEFRAFTDPDDPTVTTEFESRDEHLDGYRRVGEDELWMPGMDAIDDAWLGNVYLKRAGEDWVMRRTVPNGVHVHDVMRWGHPVWAVGSGGTPEEWGAGNIYAHLWRSDDDGEHFRVVRRVHNEREGDARWVRMLALDDALYLFGYRSNQEGSISHLINGAFDGTSFIAAAEGTTMAQIFVSETTPLNDTTGLVRGVNVTETPLRNGAWTLEAGEMTPIDLGGATLVDLTRDGDTWIALLHDGDAYATSPDVWHTQVRTTEDFVTWHTLLSFPSEVPIRAVAAWAGHIFLGDEAGQVWRASRD